MKNSNVENELNKNALKSKLLLQVHDEIILKVYEEELDKVSELTRKCMESVVDWEVPLKVEINIGKDWYDAK